MSADLDAAVEALLAGEVVGIPTDTVYGVAAVAADGGATDRVFALKRRPKDVVLPVLVADADQALGLVTEVSPHARRLMVRYWPGALTIVMRRAAGVDFELGGDDDTIGLRVPANDVVRELCHRVGPLATTSANLHGDAPLTTAAAVRHTFGDDIAIVVDGGVCDGAPSTVVDVTGPTVVVLREGAVPAAEIAAATFQSSG